MCNNSGVGGCRSNPQAPVVIPESLAFICNRYACLLYTSDAADDMQCVDLGGRHIIKKSGRVSVGVVGRG